MSTTQQFPGQLRQQFFSHVLGPIGHHAVVNSLPEFSSLLRMYMGNPSTFNHSFSRFFEQDLLTQSSALKTLLDGLRRAITFTSGRIVDQTAFPLTKPQLALLKYLEERKHKIPSKDGNGYYVKREGSFVVEANSVIRGLQDLVKRSDGVDLTSIEELLEFAHRPELPTLMRALMAGGPGFDGYLRLDAGENAPEMMREFIDQQMPYAFLNEQGMLVINPIIVELAKKFNRLLNTDPDYDPSGTSLSGNAAGCPLKKLSFMQHTPLLDFYDAGLTDRQIEILTSGDNPTARARPNANVPNRSGIYIIERDGITETLDMCMGQVELIKEDFRAALTRSPDNKYLLRNLGLLGWQDLVLEMPVSTSSALQLSRALTGPR
ncbi:MAG: hypothetical protein U0R17_04020 [Acidimicrobiia bacterium]